MPPHRTPSSDGGRLVGGWVALEKARKDLSAILSSRPVGRPAGQPSIHPLCFASQLAKNKKNFQLHSTVRPVVVVGLPIRSPHPVSHSSERRADPLQELARLTASQLDSGAS